MSLRTFLLHTLMALVPFSVYAADGDLTPTEKATAAITAASEAHRLPVLNDDGTFSGEGWRKLLVAGRDARFFLIGEEHGIAENPRLVSQLFSELTPAGYRRLLIEISPAMADILDEVIADGGMTGLEQFYAEPGNIPAFFGMVEEMQMLVDVRAAVPEGERAFWGADYEVAGDRALIRRLQAMEKPAAAEAPLKALADASHEGWGKHAETQDPQYIFTFSGDPELVRAVARAWPERSDEATLILEALEQTLVINQFWISGKPYQSNVARASYIRDGFLQRWQSVETADDLPKVMAKYGANHMVRGRNMTNTYDLGALMPEIAEQRGEGTVSVMILPGRNSPTAVLNAKTWTFESAPPKDGYQAGLEPLFTSLLPEGYTLFDLRAMRADTWRWARFLDDELLRVVFGFDFLLVMTGSTASQGYQRP